MTIGEGLVLDRPAVTIPWTIDERKLEEVFGDAIRQVTDGYWVAGVTVFGGLECRLGFHFSTADGRLAYLEFFRASYDDQQLSYEEFQRHFEGAFGMPTHRRRGSEGLDDCLWELDTVEILHYVIDRFGPEEHMEIRRKGSGRGYWRDDPPP